MDKTELLNSITSKSGATHALRAARSLLGKTLPILAYHRINEYDKQYFDNDIELISATPETFERQISYISKYYQPITFKDLIASNDNNNYNFGHKPPVIITFDDGYNDNYEKAYPILKKYNCPATFFIVTNTVDNSEPLWFDLIAYLIMRSNKRSINIDENTIDLGTTRHYRRNSIAKLLVDLRTIDNDKRLTIVDSIKDQLRYSDDYQATTKYLSWNEVKIMHENGMEIGSHTQSHPILSSMTHENIDIEVSNSKRIIEDKLQTECEVFAYPVGGFEEYNEFALQALEDSNYKLACSYEPGLNALPIKDKYHLRRIHIERYTSFSSFRNILISPIFGYK